MTYPKHRNPPSSRITPSHPYPKHTAGEKVNGWTIVDTIEGNGKIVYVCMCRCGNKVKKSAHELHNPKFFRPCCRECKNMYNRMQTKQLKQGDKFGRLTVICKDKERSMKNHRQIYVCKCACGNVSYPRYTDLVTGKTKSCGCVGKSNIYALHGIDTKWIYDGDIFGNIQVISRTGSMKGETYWACRCTVCGKNLSATSNELWNGIKTGCSYHPAPIPHTEKRKAEV